jgi:hypothetical protein
MGRELFDRMKLPGVVVYNQTKTEKQAIPWRLEQKYCFGKQQYNIPSYSSVLINMLTIHMTQGVFPDNV